MNIDDRRPTSGPINARKKLNGHNSATSHLIDFVLGFWQGRMILRYFRFAILKNANDRISETIVDADDRRLDTYFTRKKADLLK